MRRAVVLMMAVFTTLAIAGAALAQSPSDTDEQSSLNVGLTYDLYTSNPLRACGCGAEYEWLALNYDLLIRFDEQTLGPAPGLAEELPTEENGGISEDGMTYTFKIREGVTWHDGEPLTAHDVAFTYEFVLNNKIGAFDNYLPFDPTFEVPDDHTLIWHMSEPNLSPLAPPWIPILPEHIWSEFDGDKEAARAFENVPAVGSGPFQLVEWKDGQFWRVEANEDYWDGAPKVDEIVFRAFDNQETMSLALRDGEVDVVSGLLPTLAESVAEQPDIDVHESAGRGFLNFAFNFGGQGDSATNHPAIKDVEVRRAIGHAIDKQALVDRVLLGYGEVGTGLMSTSSPWHWEPEEPRGFDLELANQILDDAGYEDTDGDGVREMPGGGEPLEFEVFAASSVPSAPPTAKLIASWVAEIGIELIVRPVGDGVMNKVWGEGSFDAYLWGWYPDPDPDFILSVFTTAQCGNWSDGCYSDPAYDEMYEEQRLATTVEERREVVDRMEEHLYENVAEDILYYEGGLEAYRTDTFTGYSPSPEPDGYLVFGYLPYQYMDIEPLTAADGTDAEAGSDSIPLWIWAAAAIGVVAIVLVIGRVRKGREDDRI
ncbi:MAG: ABC transporter substrate-binding protein [Actinomycetota bacterium]